MFDVTVQTHKQENAHCCEENSSFQTYISFVKYKIFVSETEENINQNTEPNRKECKNKN